MESFWYKFILLYGFVALIYASIVIIHQRIYGKNKEIDKSLLFYLFVTACIPGGAIALACLIALVLR